MQLPIRFPKLFQSLVHRHAARSPTDPVELPSRGVGRLNRKLVAFRGVGEQTGHDVADERRAASVGVGTEGATLA